MIKREKVAKRVKGREFFLRLMSKLWVGVGSYHMVYKFKFGRYLFNRLAFVFVFPCLVVIKCFPGLVLACLVFKTSIQVSALLTSFA